MACVIAVMLCLPEATNTDSKIILVELSMSAVFHFEVITGRALWSRYPTTAKPTSFPTTVIFSTVILSALSEVGKIQHAHHHFFLHSLCALLLEALQALVVAPLVALLLPLPLSVFLWMRLCLLMHVL
jgi:hypothetical protein